METGLMRVQNVLGFVGAIGLLSGGLARADGRCDLNTVVGYQLAFGKPITGYVEKGVRHHGYEGCAPDRVLLFADGNGVRCKDTVPQHLDDPPTAYLFGRSMADMKLCVEGELMEVSPTN
jgi:hypothetical protein